MSVEDSSKRGSLDTPASRADCFGTVHGVNEGVIAIREKDLRLRGMGKTGGRDLSGRRRRLVKRKLRRQLQVDLSLRPRQRHGDGLGSRLEFAGYRRACR